MNRSSKNGAREQRRAATRRGTVRAALAAAGLELPQAHPTKYDYIPLSIHERTAFLAGQIPKTGAGAILHSGRVGREVTLEQARDAARLCVLQGLAWLESLAGGLDNVAKVLRIDVFVAADENFLDISDVADAASGVLAIAFDRAGRHPRSVLGVSRLPRNAPVLVELTVALYDTVATEHD